MIPISARRLDLVLRDWVPNSSLSLNGRHRTHWRVIQMWRDDALTRVYVALQEALPFPWFERARVEFTFVYPTRRRRDPDGLSGLCKPCLDALVRWSVIPDDDSEHVELSVRAVVEPKVLETRISITELLAAVELA